MGFVDGTKPSSAVLLAADTDTADAMPQPNPAYAVWMRQDQALLSMLVSSLSDEVMPIAVGRRTSRALWEAIVQTLSSSSRARALNLLGQLQGLEQGDSSVADYIGRAQPVTLQELADFLGAQEFIANRDYGGAPAALAVQHGGGRSGRGGQNRGGGQRAGGGNGGSNRSDGGRQQGGRGRGGRSRGRNSGGN
ncbi:PREDICTED: RNA-binding protein FUS-like [Ipomoea nil]|uniref:RNA-binding protein FUS-like n=1 Tax=Ipomoea nil TaxID=35883 RepID=UPI000901D9F1|nr:PREDICTED: RNA-binding protein FUS-like [Ipomoea nil]